MGIPDDLICLLRNLYAGQEATVRTGHGLDAWGWCTGTTQRDGMGKEEGSGWGTHEKLKKKKKKNWTWNNRLVPNRKRNTSRLYIITLLI